MPAIIVYGLYWQNDRDIINQLISKFHDLPVYRDEAVLNIVESMVIDTKHNQKPYVAISGCVESNEKNIRLIANHFVDIIDVEAYSPTKGVKAFQERGEFFSEDCFEI